MFVVILVSGFSACLDRLDTGDRDGANPALESATQQGALQLASPAFGDGEQIPKQYGYEQANINPPLTIENVPADAVSLAFVMDDPDAIDPAGKIWVHWLVWNIPPEFTSIPEDWAPTRAIEGENDFDEIGYGGPNPPDEEHTYRFKLYALDTILNLDKGASVVELGPAMDGHVIARTQLTGTYSP